MRNITFDQEKLSAIIVAYKKYFPSHWKDEMYKWEAVQHFQKYWDVNAQNFLDMFMEATDKTYNLLANMNNYPRGMIKSFSTVDPEAVRSMFIQLFDESKELSERIDHFMSSAEELRVKYDDGTWKQQMQSVHIFGLNIQTSITFISIPKYVQLPGRLIVILYLKKVALQQTQKIVLNFIMKSEKYLQMTASLIKCSKVF